MLSKVGEVGFLDGLMLGMLPDVQRWTKFGYGTIGTAQSTIISSSALGELYTYLDSAQTLAVASTDADDTELGLGCGHIKLFGLDADFCEQNEVIIMNGQTPVETTLEYSRIYRMYNDDEAGHDAQGQVYCGPATATWTLGEPDHVVAHIDSYKNQTQMAIYTVPSGYRLIVTETVFDSLKDKEVEMWSVVRNGSTSIEASNKVFRMQSNFGLYRNVINTGNATSPPVLKGGSEFEIRGKLTVGPGSEIVFIHMTGYLIPEKYFSNRS